MLIATLLQSAQAVSLSTETVMVGSLVINGGLIGLVYTGLARKQDKNTDKLDAFSDRFTRVETKIGDANEGLIHEVGNLRAKSHAHAEKIGIIMHRHEEEDRRHGPVDRRET